MKDLIIYDLEEYIETFFVFEKDTYIVLDMINIKPEYRNQGIASKIMERLCKYADSKNKCILLTPEPPETEHSININRLTNFYIEFGFQRNKGSIRDYSMPSYSFKRLPE